MTANAQITVDPIAEPKIKMSANSSTFSFFRGFIDVAAIIVNQQLNLLHLQLRDAALRYFKTLPDATQNDLELSLTAHRDHFANQDFQELHVLIFQQVQFDPITDSLENFVVNLQTRAQKVYPTLNRTAVAALALPGEQNTHVLMEKPTHEPLGYNLRRTTKMIR